ncbi:hypothetical protein VKT23_011089 [Stygiomarasmius scandens]|uniref:Uncharacterized protein n=1 Tax=Marasmiellus scandens TaxID=2682957 RepID=A0ABR1JAF6_9AGAR
MQSTHPSVQAAHLELVITIAYGPSKSPSFPLRPSQRLRKSASRNIFRPDLKQLKLPQPAWDQVKVVTDGCVEACLIDPSDTVKNDLKKRMSGNDSRIESSRLRGMNIIKVEMCVDGETYRVEALAETEETGGNEAKADQDCIATTSLDQDPEPSASTTLKRKHDAAEDDSSSETRTSSRQAAKQARLRIRKKLDDEEEESNDEKLEKIQELSTLNAQYVVLMADLESELAKEQKARRIAEKTGLRVREQLGLEKEDRKKAETLSNQKYAEEHTRSMQEQQNKYDKDLQAMKERFKEERDGHEKNEGFWADENRRLEKKLKEAKKDRDWAADKLDAEREKRAEEKEARRVLREQYQKMQDECVKKDEALQETQLALEIAIKEKKEAWAAHATCGESEEGNQREEVTQHYHDEELARLRDEIMKVEGLLHNAQDRLCRSQEARKLDRENGDALKVKYRELEEMVKVEKAERKKSEDALRSSQQDRRPLGVELGEREHSLRKTLTELKFLGKRVANVEADSADVRTTTEDVSNNLNSKHELEIHPMGLGVQYSVLGHLYSK